ncbi:MAG: hypothetical protein IJ889_00175 [Eubacterium sp.]|nr:hypothetical protein [Eubacterium sp.]MBR2247309.1 hypothetical protein [Bacilli bacterium]
MDIEEFERIREKVEADPDSVTEEEYKESIQFMLEHIAIQQIEDQAKKEVEEYKAKIRMINNLRKSLSSLDEEAKKTFDFIGDIPMPPEKEEYEARGKVVFEEWDAKMEAYHNRKAMAFMLLQKRNRERQEGFE